MKADAEKARERPDLTMPILELAAEDWFGLWEIYFDVSRAVKAIPDEAFRHQLRDRLATMIDEGLLEAATWSYDPPRRMTAEEVRTLPIDSGLWVSPQESGLDEQLRVSATEKGRKTYFREPS